ncbi:MAG: bifunctional adenosylcobinamide kinase/adenosylcobinamide-phosphate guanylyltransferase [Lachnospiraceae bacterium]|nr:bifunctional adenosylcobinamide kinase/adenosylcobinamide-phosphate guanylyltransferase [Lachnospiraceae bacterium]
MILIIGGAYQGKLTWALAQNPGLQAADLRDGMPSGEADCLYHLEALTRKACAAGEEAEQFLREFLPKAAHATVISREIGSGIVPMDAEERRWREFHGAVLQRLARESTEVWRIFCGLAERIK